MEIFGVREKKDVLGVNVFDNPNISDEIKERMRSEEVLDFRMNYPFTAIEGYYESEKRGYIPINKKLLQLCDK